MVVRNELPVTLWPNPLLVSLPTKAETGDNAAWKSSDGFDIAS